MPDTAVSRRALLCGSAVGLAGLAHAPSAQSAPMRATAPRTPPVLSGEDITLTIGHGAIRIDGRPARAVTINGGVPGPTLRLRQGQSLRLTVVNDLDEESSIHWHGLLLPFHMDGVPGVSFPGIPPRGRFTYEFPITQTGTYWYHSHSGLQELMGAYGAIVIDPAVPLADSAPDQVPDQVLVLSDHSFTHPARILRNLKVEPGYYNHQPQTFADLIAGRGQTQAQRLEWAAMRMDPTDISDVTGVVLRYLVNGHGVGDNCTVLATPGVPTRLRLVNAGGMTFFNVRIPGVELRVVAADGQDVVPVSVDELQITPGETYDVIVTLPDDAPRTIVAEAMDRSGLARATLAPRPGMAAPVPALRERPLLTMKDMGMDHGASGHSMAGMTMRDGSAAPQVKMGPGVEMIAPMPADRTGDPGLGLEHVGHRVLTYRQLRSPTPIPDARAPTREVEVHLTGAMDRYMWSMDGQTMQQAHEALPMRTGERLRVTLINDTMMAHPIHLHGHIFDLVTGHGVHAPRKHTVNVLPGGKVSFDVTAEPGDWAFHCHLFLHMAMGMMRIVKVRPA
ncbi:multicopper oxidase domain-containing protein [Novosphingobium sp. FSY-8]|uniref:Multicopper oxidase domain-containing protein n=1 Tax=Novosphingobium ovatum TaxID=1908523 RepID=A0ABW9XD25_9SPHN|nr:multicopper oxidase domain-containing protein [Novosphingobium ovatum]NBC36423.1 multicopper oxidase domain-containing protein [Novosphingobium ovatum]